MGESTGSSASGGRRRLAFIRGRSGVYEVDGPTRMCRCGMVAPLRTSWTELNPGRRFFGCQNYQQGRGCGYFHWHDNELGERSTEVINELLAHVERLHKENVRERRGDIVSGVEAEISSIVGEMKKNERRLKLTMGALLVTWLFIFVISYMNYYW